MVGKNLWYVLILIVLIIAIYNIVILGVKVAGNFFLASYAFDGGPTDKAFEESAKYSAQMQSASSEFCLWCMVLPVVGLGAALIRKKSYQKRYVTITKPERSVTEE